MDGPGYSPAVYPVWFLMKEARALRVPVLLEGQGADEALGGYPQYSVLDIIEKFKRSLLHIDAGALLTTIRAWQGLTRTFTHQWAWLWLLRESFPC